MGVKCLDLTYIIVDPLTIRIGGATKSLIPHHTKSIIQSLESRETGNICIALGLTIEIRKQKYKINIIEQKYIGNNVIYEISVAKRTKAYTYVLPMLGENQELFMMTKLVNVFIATEKNTDCIALLYRFSSDSLFLQLEKSFKKFSYFREIEDTDPYHVLFVFNVPPPYRKLYNYFVTGQYSKFNKLYKFHILQFFNLSKDSQTCQILFKSKKRKEFLEDLLEVTLPENSELLSIIDEKETYSSKIYKPKKIL